MNETKNLSKRHTGELHPVDVHVGNRIRLRRTLQGLSQEKLGEAIGLTFQQVQKYERGANRVGASKMWEISKALDVPVGFFYDDLPADGGSKAAPASTQDYPMHKRETLELVRAYYRITNPDVRRKVFDLAKTLGRTETEDADTAA